MSLHVENPARARIRASATPNNLPPTTVAQAFLRSVDRYDDREALRSVAGESVSYAELGRRVQAAVAGFAVLGISAGDRVAIYLPNGVDWAVLTFAAALTGSCVVPVNTRYRADELGYAVVGSQAKVIFTCTEFLSNPLLDRLREVAGGEFAAGSVPVAAAPDLRAIVMMDNASVVGTTRWRDALSSGSPLPALEPMTAERRGEEPMWLFWTSGTTSKPKAALMPQSTIEIVWQWTTLVGYRPDDRVLASRPLFYIAGHFWCLLAPLLHGACSVLGNRFTTEEMVELARRERISVLSGNPMMFKRLVQDPAFDGAAFDQVRLGYFSGSALPAAEMKQIAQAIGYDSLVQTYGMTELGGFIMSTLPEDDIDATCASCGYPFADIELRIVSADTGLDVPQGEVGMLVTRGEKLLAYANLPAAERSRFYDADGWYRTGDLMRQLADGRYQLIGRTKDLIKVGGENVTAAEIEDTLMRHPDVSLAAVVARPDASRGEVPVAFVELRFGGEATMTELPAWTRAHMAPFKVPAEFYRMEATEWPMTATGKIAKHELATRVGD